MLSIEQNCFLLCQIMFPFGGVHYIGALNALSFFFSILNSVSENHQGDEMNEKIAALESTKRIMLYYAFD